jgi:hypothetical protein
MRPGLLLAILFLVAGCAKKAPDPPIAPVAATSAHPDIPVFTVASFRTYASDFPDFYREKVNNERSYSFRGGTELTLHLHTPWPMAPLPQRPMMIESIRDNLGTQLAPLSVEAKWPSDRDNYSGKRLSADAHHVLLHIRSRDTPAPGATSLRVRGTVAVPMARGRRTQTFDHSPFEPGSMITVGPVTMRLKSSNIDPQHKDTNSEKIVPTRYSYEWDVNGPIDQIESLAVLDRAGNALRSSWTFVRGPRHTPSISATFLEPVEAADVRVAFYESVETVPVPVDVTLAIAGVPLPAPPAAAPDAKAAGEAPVRLLVLKTGTPIEKSLWNISPLAELTYQPPDGLPMKPGILISGAVHLPDEMIADFKPADVVIESAIDDRGTNILPGAQAHYGLFDDDRTVPRERYQPTATRRAVLFMIRLTSPPGSDATSIRLRGRIPLLVSKQKESATIKIPNGKLQEGQTFTAGPHKITLTKIRERGADIRYDFNDGENALLDPLKFLDASGAVLDERHYYTDRTMKSRTYSFDKGTAAFIKITYMANPQRREIPFDLKATLGL